MEKTIPAKEILMKIKEYFNDTQFTIDELKIQLKNSFENKLETLIFQNCHESQFNINELIEFFVQKGKLMKEDNKFKLVKSSCHCTH
jgi:probable metal-binding protein